MSKKNRKKIEPIPEPVVQIKDFQNSKNIHYIMVSILFLIISLSFFKIAFLNYAPDAGDTNQWRTSAEVLIEYNKSHKDQALWNSNIFSGMPSYLTSFRAVVPFINNIKTLTNNVMNWRIFMLFMAGLGMYILMINLKFEPLIALMAAFSFALSCHFIGLIEIGHNTKIRSIIYLPWIFWAVHLLFTKRSILALGLTSIFLIGQLRESHPQIAYYTYLMILLFWIYQLFTSFQTKEFKKFITFTILLIIGFVITIIAVAQPYLSIKEYGEFSIRGGSSGLDTDYATSWSFHPWEILTFIIPDFFGGVSPHYWGWMPFTQTSMYMGIVILFFAVSGIFLNRSKLMKFLVGLSILTLFFSFGRHFSILSDFLLNYLPGYNKFRVPATILILLQFSIVIMAGLGLQGFIERIKTNDNKFKERVKKTFFVIIALLILFAIFGGAWKSLSFTKEVEAGRYAAAQLNQLKTMRYDKLINDGYRALLFLIAISGILFLFAIRKISKNIFLILILILGLTDILIVDKRFLKTLIQQEKIDQKITKSKLDKFLLDDEETFRIYPLGGEFGQNKWGTFHQTIGGYHGAKMKRYQEIIANCLNKELEYRVPINWNIVNMLNVKYVIFDQKLPFPNMEYAFHDRKLDKTAYRNKDYLPRAWFVKNIEVISEKEEIWNRMNSQGFDPDQTALLEQEIPHITHCDTSSVKMLSFDLHNIKFETKSDSSEFLVISEIYYPKGWKAFIDNKETEILATNYILRGLVVPAGSHKIEMIFKPETYDLSVKLSYLGIILSVLLTLIGSGLYFKNNLATKKTVL
ncbi:MAG: YfhO family protein [Candidatus Cloacimonetes bacterium]|nr:YfhO family protein [Candidatus Cloacimonadota bacterium]